jgi:hypothetical protein
VLACKNNIRRRVHQIVSDIDALNPFVLWKQLTSRPAYV